MPKSNKTNRKGYFVQQLRMEGLNQSTLISKINKKGNRKQPKIAAKQARQRKKIYMTHMEQRVTQLSFEIQQLKRQVASLKQENQILRTQQIKEKKTETPLFNRVQSLVVHGQVLQTIRFEGLLKQIRSLSINLENNNNEEVSRNLSILRDKYGISGRQRLKSIDDLFDKIVSIIMPMHFRLLMENCLDNKQFYSLLGGSHLRSQKLIKLQQKTRQLLTNVRPQIIKQHEQYDRILKCLVDIRTRIKGQNYKCQSIVDEIEDGINPTFIGRLLLDLDFCRVRDNLETIYPMNFWSKCKDDGFEMVIPPRRVESYGNEAKQTPLFRFEDDMEIINELFS